MTIGDFPLSPYAFTFWGAIGLGFLLVYGMLRKKGISRSYIGYSMLLNLVCMLYGAKMYNVVLSGFTVSILKSGFASMGAVIGLLLGIFLGGFFQQENRSEFLAAYITVVPLMYAVSKIGCFLSGCCHGISFDGVLAVTYQSRFIQGGPYFPVQLVESVVFLFIFFVGVYLYRKENATYRVQVVILLCSVFKFSLEYLREEHVGKSISANQILCIAFFVPSVILLVRKLHNRAQVDALSDHIESQQ